MTGIEQIQARLLLAHLAQILGDGLLEEALEEVIEEPTGLTPRLQAHLTVIKNPSAARTAKIAALRALIKLKRE